MDVPGRIGRVFREIQVDTRVRFTSAAGGVVMNRELCGHIRCIGYLTNKRYRAMITLYESGHRIRDSRRLFRTATGADDYAKRWRERVIRFCKFANQPKPEILS